MIVFWPIWHKIIFWTTQVFPNEYSLCTVWYLHPDWLNSRRLDGLFRPTKSARYCNLSSPGKTGSAHRIHYAMETGCNLSENVCSEAMSGHKLSPQLKVSSAVFQFSVLEHLLFLIFINYFPVFITSRCFMCADNLKVISTKMISKLF